MGTSSAIGHLKSLFSHFLPGFLSRVQQWTIRVMTDNGLLFQPARLVAAAFEVTVSLSEFEGDSLNWLPTPTIWSVSASF